MSTAAPPLVDLRSDTVTRPTPAMRQAMMDAPLGDDVFGDDPTVNALQARIAAITGKEAALFMPSGTQSNFCGILAHCGRGDEYIVGQLAHTYRYEGGGAAVLGSVQPQPLAQDAVGRMQLADIAPAIKPDDPHFARTRLLCLENTWNGHVMPDDYLQGAVALARERGLATHLDGARLFNAAVASARPGQGASARWPAGRCARPACWRRRRCTRWSTTSSGWRTTTRWPSGWRGACAARKASACARPTPISSSPTWRASAARRCWPTCRRRTSWPPG